MLASRRPAVGCGLLRASGPLGLCPPGSPASPRKLPASPPEGRARPEPFGFPVRGSGSTVTATPHYGSQQSPPRFTPGWPALKGKPPHLRAKRRTAKFSLRKQGTDCVTRSPPLWERRFSPSMLFLVHQSRANLMGGKQGLLASELFFPECSGKTPRELGPVGRNRQPIQGSNFLSPVLTMDSKKQQRRTPSLAERNVIDLGRQSQHCSAILFRRISFSPLQSHLSKFSSQPTAARNGAEGRLSPEF